LYFQKVHCRQQRYIQQIYFEYHKRKGDVHVHGPKTLPQMYNELLHKKNFNEILKLFTLIGSGFFEIKGSSDPRFPQGGLLTVNFKEISLLDRRTRLVLMTTAYDTIVNFRFDDGEFVMKTGDLMTKNVIRFQTPQGFEIADLIQAYILMRVSEAKSPTTSKNTMLFKKKNIKYIL